MWLLKAKQEANKWKILFLFSKKNLQKQQKKDASAKLIQQRLQDREKTKEQQRISGQGGSADGSGSMIRTGGSQSGSGGQNGPRRR